MADSISGGELLDLSAVRAAAARIAPHIDRTPCHESGWLSTRTGARVLVKWESLQRTGSFKLRGALNKLLRLREEGHDAVLAISAGNHGAGVAEAARLLGMRATVVVYQGAARTKVEAIRSRGAELVVMGRDYDEAEAAAPGLARERGVPFASPYNDLDVIAGQATATLELMEQAPGLEALLVPVSGGGLLAGAAVVIDALGDGPGHSVALWGVQPAAAPAMARALAAGALVRVAEEPTIADGLAGNIEAGSVTFPLIAGRVRGVVLVQEASIAAAMRGFVEHDHQVVEGSGAVGAAALLEGWRPGDARTIGLMVSGRNVDLERLRMVIAG